MYKVDPQYPFAAFVNQMIAYAMSPMMTPAALANQAQIAYAGDPLAGKKVPGSTINWNDATQVQQLVSTWYQASNTPPPADYDAVLAANVGPNQPWNYSYEQWADIGIIKL